MTVESGTPPLGAFGALAHTSQPSNGGLVCAKEALNWGTGCHLAAGRAEKTKQQMRGKRKRMGEVGENAEKDGVDSKGRDSRIRP